MYLRTSSEQQDSTTFAFQVYIYKMLLLPPRLRVVSFLAVLCLRSCFWKEIETHVTGQTPPTTTAFTANSPSSSGPNLGTFLLRTLSRSCSPTDDHQWSEIIQNMIQRFDMQDYSCQNRCDVTAEERKSNSLSFRCFCDKFCEDLGDCCFDFDALCQGHVYPPTSPLNSNETCLVPQGVIHQSYSSYAVWNTCPQNWTDRIVRQQCQDEDQNDLLRNLPVFDEDSEVHYRNVFCAKCNGAVNTAFWKLRFDCSRNNRSFNVETFNLGNEKILLPNPENCLIDKLPQAHCHYISPNSKKNGSYCQTECLRYAFPVCSQNIRFRNPQCALCNGFKLNDQDSGCEFDDYGTTPSLTILFDFTSTSKYIVHVKDWKNDVFKNTEKEFSCQTDEVFDPFVGNCKKIVSTRSQATSHGPESNDTEIHRGIRTELDNTSDDDHLQGKHNESQNWNANCTVIAFNKTDFVQLSNGSIYLKPHNKLYNNMTYMLRDSKLLLCVNFSRNFSRTEKEGGKQTITKTPALLQLLSSIGCFVSMVSLVLLLITYIVFAELRNLTGKIIINLALSLLLYQSLFLSAVKTDDQDTCLAIAVLLHFFVLSFFTWMTVMAYDMRRIFTNISGQGEQECFISQPRALLYSFVLPVALMLIFNMIALGHTVIHIIKTRKRTQQKQNRRHDTRAAVICVKMASVMGVTWILGIAANLKALSFLWYPYVVLNSLQGLFIFLSFAASGKALELYKSKLAGILRNRTPQSEAVKRGNHNCNHTEENRHSRDTRL
ncbi:hypothetical protein ACROYT_G023674 [Oculina patagonica]